MDDQHRITEYATAFKALSGKKLRRLFEQQLIRLLVRPLKQ
jgi:hypothetical protein